MSCKTKFGQDWFSRYVVIIDRLQSEVPGVGCGNLKNRILKEKNLYLYLYIYMSEELYYIEPDHCVPKQIFQVLSTLLYTAPLFSLLSFL